MLQHPFFGRMKPQMHEKLCKIQYSCSYRRINRPYKLQEKPQVHARTVLIARICQPTAVYQCLCTACNNWEWTPQFQYLPPWQLCRPHQFNFRPILTY